MPENNNDIDLTFLYEIADGSDEFIVESITMFLDQSPQIMHQIDTALKAQDWATASAAAHKVKANLGFFGMLNSQAIIQDIEHTCKAGNPNPIEVIAKFSEVNGIMNNSLVELGKIKAEKEANL
jgi:HPt (histidine-containing phosphotransfer) domain-containing protein